jgi:hypothetical protein
MSRITFVALVLGSVAGLALGLHHASLSHIKANMAKEFSAQVENSPNHQVKCGALAQLLPEIREKQIDAIVDGTLPPCAP